MWQPSNRQKKKNKEIINAVIKGKEPKVKNLKGGSCHKLDQAVYKYFLNVQSQSIFFSGPVPKEKAMSYVRQLQIADFKGSDGWLVWWKMRQGIKLKAIVGEANSCTPEMTALLEQTTLPSIEWLSECVFMYRTYHIVSWRFYNYSYYWVRSKVSLWRLPSSSLHTGSSFEQLFCLIARSKHVGLGRARERKSLQRSLYNLRSAPCSAWLICQIIKVEWTNQKKSGNDPLG